MIDLILHLNVHLSHLAATLGPAMYWLLFAIIFAETGLVIFPFLPGDSLLFAVGALAALPDTPLKIELLIALLITAAILGNTLNYFVGVFFGRKMLERQWIRTQHITRTEHFFAKYGTKTIFLARFVPIVRSFAPFVAGLGHMSHRHFAISNILGAIVWIAGLTLCGYWFGNLPGIQHNFHLVIVAILVISVLPIGIEFIRVRRSAVP